MKKIAFLFCVGFGVLTACNDQNTSQDNAAGADTSMTSDNASMDGTTMGNDTAGTSGSGSGQADTATAGFLMKAADGGMAEVEAGKMAQDKATHADVKKFAAMMVEDHTGANSQVKSLAAGRNVNLPAEPSEEKKRKAAETAQKKGTAFDKAYMDMMVKDHKETISLFERGQSQSSDQEVKTFITNTLPKLRAHLDSAQAIQGRLK